MLNRSSVLMLSVIVLASGCRPAADPAAAPVPIAAPAPPAVNPAGRWALMIDAQGQAIEIILDLRKISEEEYAGSATSAMFPPMQLTKATLIGNRLVLIAPAPTGDTATFTLIVAGDVMTGDWSMPGMGSGVTGRRLP